MSLRDRLKRLEQNAGTGCPGCNPGIVFADQVTLPDGTITTVPPIPATPACTCKGHRPDVITAIVFTCPYTDAALDGNGDVETIDLDAGIQ